MIKDFSKSNNKELLTGSKAKLHVHVTGTLTKALRPGLPAVYLHHGALVRTAQLPQFWKHQQIMSVLKPKAVSTSSPIVLRHRKL